MRRVLVLLAAVALAAFIAAAPAWAQGDDPFDPDAGENEETEQPGQDGPFETPDPNETTPTPEPTQTGDGTNSDNLPETGAEPVAWVVIAYGLIAIGVGVVVISRLLEPRRPKK